MLIENLDQNQKRGGQSMAHMDETLLVEFPGDLSWRFSSELLELAGGIGNLANRLEGIRLSTARADQRGQAKEVMDVWIGMLNTWYKDFLRCHSNETFIIKEQIAIVLTQHWCRVRELGHSLDVENFQRANFFSQLNASVDKPTGELLAFYL